MRRIDRWQTCGSCGEHNHGARERDLDPVSGSRHTDIRGQIFPSKGDRTHSGGGLSDGECHQHPARRLDEGYQRHIGASLRREGLYEQSNIDGKKITGLVNWRLPALQKALKSKTLRPLAEMIEQARAGRVRDAKTALALLMVEGRPRSP